MADSDMYKQEEHDRPVERSPRGRYIRFDIRLGTGAYKTVYKAYDTDQGIDVAWNAIDIGLLPSSEKTRIIQEVQLLQKLEHKNIINFYGSWFSKEKNQVVFITEIMTSGTLKSYIKRVQFVKWKIIRRWCIQILEGLHYLHSQNPPVIHRDLKCDNIFINGNTGDLRIGDLGLSTQLAVHKRMRAQSVLGTPEFMAPELYDENYDEKVDIYAFGMCVLEMVTKEVPYSECVNPAQIYKKVTAGIRPKGLQRIVSQAARDFIELCLSRGNGEVDVTASYLMEHPFLKPQDDDGEMVQVLDEDELEGEAVAHTMPPRPAVSLADELNMESASKGLDDTKLSDRRRQFPSLSMVPEEMGSSFSSQPGPGSTTMSMSSTHSAPAEEKSAGKRHMLMRAHSSPADAGAPAAPLLPPRPPVPVEVDEPLSGKKEVDSNVDQFLATMPGSEIRIQNTRMNVMGGRGHRLELTNPESDVPEDDADAQSTDSTPSSDHGQRAYEEAGSPRDNAVPHSQALDQNAPGSEEGSDERRSSGSTLRPDQSVGSQASHSSSKPPGRPPSSAASSSSSSSSSQKQKQDPMLSCTVDQTNDRVLLFTLRILIDGKPKEVKFPFNMFQDCWCDIACELATGVNIRESQVETIANSINFLVKEARKKYAADGDDDFWDEAPEPHSFSSKQLPHVSKMTFLSNNTRSSNPPQQYAMPERHMDSAGVVHGYGVGMQHVYPHATEGGTGPLYGHERSGNPMRSTPLIHTPEDPSVQSDEWATITESRERGISMGSASDPNYAHKVRQMEERKKMGRSPYDNDNAMAHDEQNHMRIMEYYDRKMREYKQRKQLAEIEWNERKKQQEMDFVTGDGSDMMAQSSEMPSNVSPPPYKPGMSAGVSATQAAINGAMESYMVDAYRQSPNRGDHNVSIPPQLRKISSSDAAQMVSRYDHSGGFSSGVSSDTSSSQMTAASSSAQSDYSRRNP